MKTIASLNLQLFLFVTLLCFTNLQAQKDSLSGPLLLDKLIGGSEYEQARTILDQHLAGFKSEQNYDTLVHYIKYVGSFKLANDNSTLAIEKAETFVAELIERKDPYVSKQSLLELAWLYDDAGAPKKAYETTQESLRYADKIADPLKADKETIQYHLGIRASDFGDIALAKKHHLKALSLRRVNPKEDFEGLYSINNAVGGMMWHSAKLDSAMYYYREALKALKSMEPNSMNTHYRPSLVQSNIAVLLQATGKVEDGIEYSKLAISNIQKYLEAPDDESRKLRAEKFKLMFVDNLGAFYHSVGEFKKADGLITYSYHEKLKILEEDDPKIMISLIILGEAKMGIKDYHKAGEYLDKALEIIQKKPDNQFYWRAAALVSRASVYDELGDPQNAEKLYRQSEALYKRSLQGQYTKDYLDEFIEMSLFYAKLGKGEKALDLAMEGYNFAQNSSFKGTVQEFHHILNVAEVHYLLNNYAEALKFSEESLALKAKGHGTGVSRVDSIQIESRKPMALLTKVRAQYALKPDKDEKFLKSILDEIEKGIDVLERRRTIINSYEDLNVMVSENKELFSFAKKLRLDLFGLSQDQEYLVDLLSIHESSIYNRIRARLDIKKNIAFANLPESILDKEKQLKLKINSALTETSGKLNPLEDFFQATNQWNDFLDTLEQNHPRYFKMRYATIEEPLDALHTNVPKNTTIVRYVFIEGNLYAFVITSKNMELVPLQYEPIKNHIASLNQNQKDVQETANLLHELYQQLWQPLTSLVNTQKTLIIPDGDLFNLSFEMLTPTKISSYQELATNSLLARHDVSYNYSLLLLDETRKKVDFSNNFIAFVPEFSNTMKTDYQIAITDSIDLDKTYLTLLPQPFSVDLAEQFRRKFKGSSFLNEKASKQVFTNSAREHKIIHIGTHAESNNVSPELSRLIFAKNAQEDVTINDNYLYTYEIYNQNLSSNLAILTACETGKPTYQAGEGMISLAHAFNYAGSESMLTSLWKIDEQSSTSIISLFYNYLLEGFSKDEALRKAKLDYMTNAVGRTIEPQYWAGLVLIGDTAPIDFSNTTNWLFWIIPVVIVTILFFCYIKKKKLNSTHF